MPASMFPKYSLFSGFPIGCHAKRASTSVFRLPADHPHRAAEKKRRGEHPPKRVQNTPLPRVELHTHSRTSHLEGMHLTDRTPPAGLAAPISTTAASSPSSVPHDSSRTSIKKPHTLGFLNRRDFRISIFRLDVYCLFFFF